MKNKCFEDSSFKLFNSNNYLEAVSINSILGILVCACNKQFCSSEIPFLLSKMITLWADIMHRYYLRPLYLFSNLNNVIIFSNIIQSSISLYLCILSSSPIITLKKVCKFRFNLSLSWCAKPLFCIWILVFGYWRV